MFMTVKAILCGRCIPPLVTVWKLLEYCDFDLLKKKKKNLFRLNFTAHRKQFTACCVPGTPGFGDPAQVCDQCTFTGH